MAIYEGFASVLLHQVAPHKIDFCAFLLEGSLGIIGIFNLLRKVANGNAFATLSGE